MSRFRVVLDTNVIISAAINPEGLEARIVELVIARELALHVSTAVVAEYASVFARPKFVCIDPARVARLLQLLKGEATMVAPRQVVTASKDEQDNRFLECAEAAGAEYLITGNKRHFPSEWGLTRVVNAREFLCLMESIR